MRALFLLPNLLSLLRLFLAFLLFCNTAWVQLSVIAVSAVTDFLDGYIARRYNMTSRLGTLLDPIADKVFVLIALIVFDFSFFYTVLFLMREISLVLFYVWVRCTKVTWHIQSFFCGKAMTTCQFIILLQLACHTPVPTIFFVLLALFGVASFFELVYLARNLPRRA